MQFVSGPPVVSYDFIGREDEIKTLNEKIIGKRNWSIVGLPRIGKTSLVDETLRRYATDYENRNIYYIRSAINSSRSWEENLFYEFANLLTQLISKTENNNLISKFEDLFNDIQNYRKKEDQWFIICTNLMAHLSNIQIVIFIDEFDYAPQYFNTDLMFWRRLISVPRIRMITVSRSTLGDLFPIDSGGSNFPGIFDSTSPQYLSGFSKDDLKSLCKRAGCSKLIWNYIYAQAGDMPFFLSGWLNTFLLVNKENHSSEEEIIKLMSEAYSYNFKDVAFSLFKSVAAKGDLLNQLLYFYNSMQNNCNIDFTKCKTAKVYGIIGMKPEWRIPVLSYFLDSLQQHNDRVVLRDLFMRISLHVENTEHALRNLASEVGTSVHDVQKYVMKVSARLNAIHKKIQCALELDDLETDIRCFISETELNGFEQILGDWARYYRTKF